MAHNRYLVSLSPALDLQDHPYEHLRIFDARRSGIGYELALAALRRGDKVIATTRQRSLAQLESDTELKKFDNAAVLEMDVTASLDDLKNRAEKAVSIFGRVDVVVNNAGRFHRRAHYDDMSN